MTVREQEWPIEDRIQVRYVLVSVSDKSGLDVLVHGLLKVNPQAMFFSTGGTYNALRDIGAPNITSVEAYTRFPEMEGGLVKTLHPKIHAGLLGERYNPAHQKYLSETLQDGVYIDMVVVNLYPFEKKIAEQGVTFEGARGNIDIGGHSMLRAAAKNFMSVAVISDPADYQRVLAHLGEQEGCTTFEQRFDLARKAFQIIAAYDRAVLAFMSEQQHSVPDIKKSYRFADQR